MTPEALHEFEQQLRSRVDGEVYFDDVTRGVYATDASIYEIMPAGVLVPRHENDVLAAIQLAGEHGVSVLPRGGGTSLGGQAVGPSLVIDFTKYMDRVLEVDVKERSVRVQPGVVLDNLNAGLAEHGLMFAPDPATSSRATIGGMIGNNSSGTRSIVYGIMRDHVLSTRVALSDGTVLQFEELDGDEYDRRCRGGGRQAQILSGFRDIIEANRGEIERRFPKVMRRVMGYGLDAFTQDDRWNLSRLITGSEGTLGVVLEATLRLVPLPAARIVCVAHFADLLEAIRTVAPILEHGPSAVEIMDAEVIRMARENLSIAPMCGFIEGNPAAILIVEFLGETPDEVAAKAAGLARDLKARGLGYACPPIADPAGQADVWAVRKNGLGLMLGIKGDRKPVAVIEDSCVPVEVLPEYIDRILSFCRGRDVPVMFYAHASVGVIHVRPVLDLRRQRDIDSLKAIADRAFELVTGYGGAWSGEHGDGRVRSGYLERFFGPQVYEALREVKRLFDPAGMMNPGPIIDPPPLDRDLRYGPDYNTPRLDTEYHYREDGGFPAAVEMCTGVGACRQSLIGTMCPSFRLLRDEAHSTRGRANALRLAMTGRLGPEGLTGDGVREVMDLCLSCKACKSECPSNVDMARLKGELLQKRHDAHGLGLRERMIGASASSARRIAGWKAPIVNRVQRTALFRHTVQRFLGFDPRRRLPAYARTPLTRWFARRPGSPRRSDRKVVLFDDTYMTCHQTEVGISAVQLLESCGYQVILARAGCCQRPRISHGLLRLAKREGIKTLRNLDAYIAEGLSIVVCEPGCASALTDDLPDLIDDEALGQRVKANVLMIDEFLARELESGGLRCRFTSPFRDILIHGHCHQKSLYGTTFMKRILDGIDGLRAEEIDSGCCGMAGSFGYEPEHYDLSMAIGEQRLFPAVRNRPDGAAVVACGFSCRHQIADGTGVQALHWVQTLRGDVAGR